MRQFSFVFLFRFASVCRERFYEKKRRRLLTCRRNIRIETPDWSRRKILKILGAAREESFWIYPRDRLRISVRICAEGAFLYPRRGSPNFGTLPVCDKTQMQFQTRAHARSRRRIGCKGWRTLQLLRPKRDARST